MYNLRLKAVMWAVCLSCLVVCCVVSGFAQNQDDDLRRTLNRARNLERMNRYEDALQIHMDLYKTHPDNAQVIAGVERALLQLERYEELIQFLREGLAASPGDPSYMQKLGNALYRSGDQEQAEAVWQEIIELQPDKPTSYSAVARQYLSNGRVEESVETYLEGRQTLDDPHLFARDLAHLYSSKMDYGKATREYLLLLQGDPKNYTYVENLISHFKPSEEKDMEVARVLNEALEYEPDNSLVRKLLGGQYLRMAMPEEAFEQFKRVEEIEKTNGGTLLDFADWSFREGHFVTAIDAYRYILELVPGSPLEPKAYQGVGRSMMQSGDFQGAISTYRTLYDTYPRSKEAEFALYQIGRIQLLELDNPEAALGAFTELTGLRKRGPHYYDALFRIGECHLLKDDLKKAVETFEGVSQEQGIPPRIAEEGAFRLAEMKYYQGDFDGALEDLETVTTDFPQGTYVNDALDMIVFIEENRLFGDDALRAYVMASLKERQKRWDDAISGYERVAMYYPHSYLGDDALMSVGAIQNDHAQYEEALQTYHRILEKYPGCDACDEVQRRIGHIYEFGLRDVPKAIEAYEEVLARYPDSLLFDSVRKRIRELRARTAGAG